MKAALRARIDGTPGTSVARLVDIASEAGVSTSTAGRVLRNSHLPVAPAVAQRVREVALRLGYVPNVAARNLRGAQAKTVGLVVGDMLDPYYGTVAEAVTERAESMHGFLAVVCNIQRDPALELKYCQRLWEHRVAGLILTGGGFDQHRHATELGRLARNMQASGLVVCTLGPRLIEAPMFCVDNVLAGRMAAMQLLGAGHRRIGVVNGHALSETGRLRLVGCLDAMKDAGVQAELCEVDYRAEAVKAALPELLARKPRITGILATSDFMSQAVVGCLQALGIAIPTQVSVVGMRGTDLSASSLRITSVDVQIAECSRAALDYIVSNQASAPALLTPVLRPGETLSSPR